LSQPITQADLQPLLAVPPGALAQHEGQAVVWQVVTDASDATLQTVQPVPVKAGRTLGEVREITPVKAGALKAGDKLVAQPDARLKPGARVRPAQP